jgi:hypothetical protein
MTPSLHEREAEGAAGSAIPLMCFDHISPVIAVMGRWEGQPCLTCRGIVFPDEGLAPVHILRRAERDRIIGAKFELQSCVAGRSCHPLACKRRQNGAYLQVRGVPPEGISVPHLAECYLAEDHPLRAHQ